MFPSIAVTKYCYAGVTFCRRALTQRGDVVPTAFLSLQRSFYHHVVFRNRSPISFSERNTRYCSFYTTCREKKKKIIIIKILRARCFSFTFLLRGGLGKGWVRNRRRDSRCIVARTEKVAFKGVCRDASGKLDEFRGIS